MRQFFWTLCLISLIANVALSSIGIAQGNSSTLVKTQEQAFKFGPTVNFQSLNSEINQTRNGTVELFLKNPSLNNVH